ncbi:GNAT family N-acetyltransferase [Allonocardiopsis opalescens]|uniref:Ribosomal protein S18 acetylase RimI-like enzyme n=1 Tax=Allonocardiopsis opalescens TaxID=1144618 RepID=A0A2T0Q4Z6_9ACTN|nr:GNAT family N-acetyltransferase [Allonocardiopsis opalescens]PRX98850.1 ribosomal protein S18 acetylase RimI-like enzyme [Allonocardiopsis opalescens]
MSIRPAHPTELALLQDIEVAAGRPFADIGMAEIAGDQPLPLVVLETHRAAGRAWVATDAGDRPVGYLIASLVDGDAHIDQVSVHPGHARRGLGRALIDHLAGWAVRRGLPALTLATFRDVPWNAPYYRRIGFRPLADDELTPGLREIRRREAELGLDRWPRLCMRRDLAPEELSAAGR